jgi:adenine-specific DNA methylase
VTDIEKIMTAGKTVGETASQLHKQASAIAAGWHKIDYDGMRYLLPIITRLSHDLRLIAYYAPELSGMPVDDYTVTEMQTGYEATAGWDRDQLCEMTESWYNSIKELNQTLKEILKILGRVAKPPVSLRLLSSHIAGDMHYFAVEYKHVNNVALEPYLA